MQQHPVIITFALKKAVKRQNNKVGDDANDEELQPDCRSENKIDNTKQGVNKNDSPDNIIGLVPGLLIDLA